MRMASSRLRPPTLVMALERYVRTVAFDRMSVSAISSVVMPLWAVVAALRQAFPGALATWLTRQDDGTWLDIILWRSREEAEQAARHVHEVPEAEHWFRHIARSDGLRHVAVLHGVSAWGSGQAYVTW